MLIDLKMDDFHPDYAGQMNAYLNYFRKEVNSADDNPPVGIVLCGTKDDVVVEYAIGEMNNQVFASEYIYCIPDKEQLAEEVRFLLNEECK